MSFLTFFEKIAFTSPHTKEVKVKATPASKGGTDGRKSYLMRYHPEEGRWSCKCGDWQHRRKGSADPEHQDCKHIEAHKTKKKPWTVRSERLKAGYKFPAKPKETNDLNQNL